jgi:transposase
MVPCRFPTQFLWPKPIVSILRQKVIDAIELDGMPKSEASQIFRISRNTINLWFKQRAATGSLQAKPRSGNSQGQKITDWPKFRAFIEAYADKTQAELATAWGGVRQRTISRALNKIGFTRKKNLRLSPTR